MLAASTILDYLPLLVYKDYYSMNNAPDLRSPISVNSSGAFYEQGKEYTVAKKWEVTSGFFLVVEGQLACHLSNQQTCGSLNAKAMCQFTAPRW
jgi:hypothetical protein